AGAHALAVVRDLLHRAVALRAAQGQLDHVGGAGFAVRFLVDAVPGAVAEDRDPLHSIACTGRRRRALAPDNEPARRERTAATPRPAQSGGVSFSNRPPPPSSSSQIAASGPCSASRMRRPIG